MRCGVVRSETWEPSSRDYPCKTPRKIGDYWPVTQFASYGRYVPHSSTLPCIVLDAIGTPGGLGKELPLLLQANSALVT